MVDTTSVTTATINEHSLSILSLFYHADWVVKLVIIGLLVLSIACWTVIIDKIRLLRTLHNNADHFESLFWSNKTLDNVLQIANNMRKDPLNMVFLTAMHEVDLAKNEMRDKKILRVSRAMQATINRQVTILERYVILLATTASAAPFIGLFGTVWGIMNSFTSIAGAQQISLAVVAPGIAEALFATAIGLVAAIPASIFYNKISSDLDKYVARVDLFQDEFLTLIERDEV